MSTLPQSLQAMDSIVGPHPGTEGPRGCGPRPRTSPRRLELNNYPCGNPHLATTLATSSTSRSGKEGRRPLVNLKLAILNIQTEITDQDDFNHFLTEALKDVANKNQPLPYFVRETWPRNNILEINACDISGANPPYRLDLLPAERYPDKFFREEFITTG